MVFEKKANFNTPTKHLKAGHCQTICKTFSICIHFNWQFWLVPLESWDWYLFRDTKKFQKKSKLLGKIYLTVHDLDHLLCYFNTIFEFKYWVFYLFGDLWKLPCYLRWNPFVFYLWALTHRSDCELTPMQFMVCICIWEKQLLAIQS